MTGDPRIYCLYDLVGRAVDVGADEVRMEASARGVLTVYLRKGHVVDEHCIPVERFREDAPDAFQSPGNYLAEYRSAYELCVAYDKEHKGTRADSVYFHASGPTLMGPASPKRSVDVSATMAESLVTFLLRYETT